MKNIREKTMERVNTRSITSFIGLASIATFIPFFIHLQWVTGPLVNAILIITLFLVGIRSALILCLIPSLMALAGGLLPAVLAPVVPFIMISNAILVLVIEYIYKNLNNALKGYWAGLISGAVLKFLFLYFSVGIIAKIVVGQGLVAKIAQMMSWPQLFTAITGGFLAFLFLKSIKRI